MALYSLFKLTVLCAFFHETVHGGCCQRSASDDRVAPWEYLHGVPIVLESRTIGCTRNTWMPDKTYNKATEKCEPPAGGCCQRSPSDDRVAPWEYLHGVPIVLESRTIGCTRNTWMPDKTYNKATEKCELPAAAVRRRHRP